MSDNEGAEVFYVNQNLGDQSEKYDTHMVTMKFKDFVKDWMVENEFIYRNQLISNA